MTFNMTMEETILFTRCLFGIPIVSWKVISLENLLRSLYYTFIYIPNAVIELSTIFRKYLPASLGGGRYFTNSQHQHVLAPRVCVCVCVCV